jgi:hypothetical protein
MNGSPIHIFRRAKQELLVATLRTGIKPEDLVAIEREWGPFRVKLRQELTKRGIERKKWPQSLHWDWSGKGPDLKLLESSGYAIDYQGATQGIMLTKTASYVSRLDKGKPLVYIDYLEAAPWNWNITELQQTGEFRGIGAAMFFVAISQSETEGFHGRVGLHALPQAESFYAGSCRMANLGPDPAKQSLPYFELSQAEAQKHLRDGGTK